MQTQDREDRRSFAFSVLAGALAGLADLVYPPVCPSCGVTTGRHRGLCPRCWSAIRFIERPYCEVLGVPFAYDMGSGMLSPEAIADPPVFDRLRSAAIHDTAARAIVHSLKYRDRTDLAPMMAEWMLRASDGMLDDCDAVIPIPLHRGRLTLRKFNQAAELARHLCHLSQKPLLATTLIRRKRTRMQVGLGVEGRAANVHGAFAIAKGRENDVFGKRIVLIDDVYTTGATVSSATRALKKAGAARIMVLTFARAVHEPI